MISYVSSQIKLEDGDLRSEVSHQKRFFSQFFMNLVFLLFKTSTKFHKQIVKSCGGISIRIWKDMQTNDNCQNPLDQYLQFKITSPYRVTAFKLIYQISTFSLIPMQIMGHEICVLLKQHSMMLLQPMSPQWLKLFKILILSR